MPARQGITRHIVGLVVLGVAALLLTGCLRSEMAVTVDGDGSGTTAVEVYFDEVELDASGLSQDDLIKLVETATQSIDGAEVSGVGRQGSRGFRVSIPFENYNQLTQALTAGEYGGVSTRLFQSFQVAEGDEGRWSMNAVVDPVGFRATLAQVPAGFGGQAMQMESSTEFVFSMALPGKVLRSNADSVDGGTARWELTGDTQAASFSMENEPAGLLTTFQMLMVGIGALLVVGFILVLTTAAGSRRRWSARRQGRRRRRRLRKARGVDAKEQWQPKAPVPGTTGGRDESVLPGLAAASAPDMTNGHGESDLPGLPAVAVPIAGAVAAAPTMAPPVVPVQPAPAPVAPIAPAPVAPPAAPVPPVAPVPAAAPPAPVAPIAPAPVAPPAAPPQFTAPPTVAPTPPAAPPPTVPQPPAPAPAPAPATDAQPVAYTVVTVQPIAYDAATAQPAGGEVQPAPAPAPAPAQAPAAPQVPDQSHWLAPNPHQDPEAHWLDQPPPDEAPADPNGWVPLPPRSSDVPRFEYPEIDDI